MAKIKRFYLFIAALIWSKSYDATAAVDCTNFTGIYNAQACYNQWTSKYTSNNFTYGDWLAAGFNETDYATCYGWSADYEDGDETQYATSATCYELYEDELASFCCEKAGAYKYNGYYCTDILQGSDQCQDTVSIDCSGDQERELIAEWENAITKSEGWSSGTCYTALELDNYGYEPELVCLTSWNYYDEDGNIPSDAACCDVDRDYMVSLDCLQMTSSPQNCWSWYKNEIVCASEEEETSCGSGSFLTSGVCKACPEYEYPDGSTEGSFIWSDTPAYSNTACYVPKNIGLWDDTGNFVFNWNCHYTTGS